MLQKGGMTVALSAATLLLLAGCATTGPGEGGAAQDGAGAEAGEGPGAEASGMAEGGTAESAALAGGSGVMEPDQHRVFFAFDSAKLSKESREILQGHAEFLQTQDGVGVTLEGHADERGSREYNLGLGERRAKAVRRILMVHGLDSGQLEIVSYGEERPLVDGHTEAAYAKNRRVEIRYEE